MAPGIPSARPFAVSLARAVEPDLGSRLADAEPPAIASSSREELPFEDGRYSGANAEIAIELRVDRTGCGVVSGDVYRVLADSRGYVASFRTAPGMRVSGAGPWTVIGQDEHGRVVEGTVSLVTHADLPGTVIGQLRFDGPLEGLPTRTPIPFVAQLSARTFRSLGIEKEIEEGVADIGTFTVGDRRIDIAEALRSAGFDTRVSGISDRIARPPQGWDMAQLHTLMSDLSQAPLLRRSWDIHMLLLSKSDRAGLLGVMFDTADALPRQGCAVFAEEIRGIQGIDHERKLIQTTVHELGHALNLAHRFERVVGRADSLSFMNYDWRFRGGRREEEFWNQFTFTFDPDELEFLRHAPLPPLIPGGAPFHSVSYWADGTGGYSPYVPETPLPGWALTLILPESGPVLRFAQPVLMRVLLTNRSGRTEPTPKFILDPKAGFLEVLIKRVHSGAVGRVSTAAESFTPLVQRCFQWDAADAVRLKDGESIEDNINLTFGSGGFAFAEPGTYDVSALLVIFDQGQQRDLVVPSNTVRIRVAAPRSDDDERDAMNFFTPEVGMYLTLGGSAALSKTRDMLDEIVERRGKDLNDPLVAHVTRARAIDCARSYVRYEDQKFSVSRPDIEQAASLLNRLRDSAPASFDAATARQTAELAEVCEARWKGEDAGEPLLVGPAVLPSDVSTAAIDEARKSSYLPIGKERFAR